MTTARKLHTTPLRRQVSEALGVFAQRVHAQPEHVGALFALLERAAAPPRGGAEDGADAGGDAMETDGAEGGASEGHGPAGSRCVCAACRLQRRLARQCLCAARPAFGALVRADAVRVAALVSRGEAGQLWLLRYGVPDALLKSG